MYYLISTILIAILLGYFLMNKKKNIKLKSDYKLIIIVNTDLKMSTGKIISQACHAVSETLLNTPKEIINVWRKRGQPKIVVKGSQNDINSLIKLCKKENILYNNICDAGKTQVLPGSNTVLSIGPESDKVLKNITGHLKLL